MESTDGVVVLQVCTKMPLFTVNVCAPVWICTALDPVVAPEVDRFAVRLVALLTVTGPNVPAVAPPTEMPGPKLAFVVPPQLVKAPVIVTLSDCVGRIVLGLIRVTVGTPASTLKVVVTCCAPVVIVTLRDPVAARLSIVIGTEALVGPFTVTVPVVMCVPKLTVVVGSKFFPVPAMTIVCVEPWCAEDGLSVALRVMTLHATCTFVTFALAVPLPFVTVQVSDGLDGCVRTVTL